MVRFTWLIPDIHHVTLEILFLALGIIVTAIGVGVYVAPNLGAGPRDSVMLNISNYMGWKVSRVRNSIELIVFFIGWMLGGPVGVGTIAIVMLLGTVVGYTIPQAKKFLDFVIKRGERIENLNQGTLRFNDYD